MGLGDGNYFSDGNGWFAAKAILSKAAAIPQEQATFQRIALMSLTNDHWVWIPHKH